MRFPGRSLMVVMTVNLHVSLQRVLGYEGAATDVTGVRFLLRVNHAMQAQRC